MGFFKRNKSSGLAAVSDKVARGIAGAINKAQHRWVKAMERLSARLSMKTKAIVLCTYLTLMFFACGYTIVKSIRNWHSSIVVETQSTMPAIITQHRHRPPSKLNEDPVRNRIHLFRHWMDSLNTTKEGKQQIDSFLKTRPGLMDSIEMTGGIYDGN
ncbi:MAG: hypothetical protein P0Y49_13915 [Candidatus Pedobacter colombiensis]|uniref:Uncharacterized protein n=1 Tax=Candidatus Pedobacter colombiensis TaxID=3121371 RepID=A0AAJ6B578_9SPHI|nr:hypothetical protein [Pedobacter sp.]WEK17895.1 MAG: hypothetical protein P0Y49_13915 [Pedobacter sp.]